MDIQLNGRTTLITGGSRGIGFAIAEKFAVSGARVAITARTQSGLDDACARILAATGATIVASRCDVSQPQSLHTLMTTVTQALGPVEILVNNAGTSMRGSFETLRDEEWQADIDQKLFAAIRLSRAVLPGMRARRWGRIINIVSIGGKAPGAHSMPTSVTRAAGIALTKALANEYAPHNILVNALCMGMIKSEQWAGFHERDAPELPLEEYLHRKGKDVPLGRLGEADEVANLACFLASDAGSYLTGTAINVDGGKSTAV